MDLNGSLSIYSLEYDESSKKLNYVDSVSHNVGLMSKQLISQFNTVGFKMAWLNDSMLLVPSSGSIVCLTKQNQDEEEWKELFLESSNSASHIIVVEKINEEYFVSADNQGQVSLWKSPKAGKTIDHSTVVNSWTLSFPADEMVFDISYSEQTNTALIISASHFIRLENIISKESIDKNETLQKETVLKQKGKDIEVNDTSAEKMEFSEEKLETNQVLAAPAIIESEDDPFLSDDALLAIDVDVFTQQPPATSAVAPTSDNIPHKKDDGKTRVTEKEPDLFEEDDFPPATSTTAAKTSTSPAVKVKASTSLGALLQEEKKTEPAKESDKEKEKTKPLSKKDQLKALFDDEAEEDDTFDDDIEEDDAKDNKKTKKNGENNNDDDDEMLIEDDIFEEMIGEDGNEVSGEDGKSSGGSAYLTTEVIKLKKQLQTKSFLQNTGSHPITHPSSSPFDEKRRRYLVWNDIGNITLREEALENRIEIRFTDLVNGKNETISDRNGFVMASLSMDGAAFATDLPEESEEEQLKRSKMTAEDLAEEAIDMNAKGSLLYYHAFTGNQRLDGINQSFRIQLYQREKITAIAVGKGFIAITTSKQFLRIFNTIGIEISVTFLKGPIVCLCAYNTSLTVVYQENSQSVSVNDCYAIALDVYEIVYRNSFKITPLVLAVSLPFFQPKQKLEWMGYDVDQKIVLALDSLGNLMALMNTLSGGGGGGGAGGGSSYQWVPIFHIPSVRKSIDHRYWPITIKANKLVFVLLNGEKKPSVYPQPVISTKPLKIPLASTNPIPLLTADKGKDSKASANAGEASNKEKFYNYHYETLKYRHLENSVNQRYALYNLDYYHSSQAPEDIEKISIYETIEMTSYVEEMKNHHQQYDRMLLKFFQEALVSQQIPFATSLLYQMNSLNTLQAAIVISNHFGKRNLAEKIDIILQQKQQMMMMSMNGMNNAKIDEGNQEGVDYPSNAVIVLPSKQVSGSIVGMKREREGEEGENHQQNKLSRKASALKSSASSAIPPSSKSAKIVSPNNPPASTQKKLKSIEEVTAEEFQYHSHDEEEKINKNKTTITAAPLAKSKGNALNPFMIEKTGNTPMKRKSVIEDLNENVKYSPSPKKTALLNVSRRSLSLLLLKAGLMCNVYYRDRVLSLRMLVKRRSLIIRVSSIKKTKVVVLPSTVSYLFLFVFLIIICSFSLE